MFNFTLGSSRIFSKSTGATSGACKRMGPLYPHPPHAGVIYPADILDRSKDSYRIKVILTDPPTVPRAFDDPAALLEPLERAGDLSIW